MTNQGEPMLTSGRGMSTLHSYALARARSLLRRHVEHCEGCQTITGNAWGLCTRCTDAETDDKEFWRGVVAADPNGVRA